MCCPNQAGTDFMYQDGGIVKFQPGRPIYECNSACLCNINCRNRVVQRGRKIPLTIFRTKNKGWGLKTEKFIKVGSFVCEYIGEVELTGLKFKIIHFLHTGYNR